MSSALKCIGGLLTIFAFFGIIWSAHRYIETNFASAQEIRQLTEVVTQTSKRLDQKIDQDRYNFVQDQIYRIQDRFGPEPKDPLIRDQLRNYKRELIELKRRLGIKDN